MTVQPKTKEGPIASRFTRDDGNRSYKMRRARRAAAVSDPSILPPLNTTSDNDPMPEPAQSVVMLGVLNVSGKLVNALFPFDGPWFQLILPADVEYDDNVPDEVKLQAHERLAMWELMIQMSMSASVSGTGNLRNRSSFHSMKRKALDQLVVVGDVLEYMSDDFEYKVFRLDQYVTRRDMSGRVVYHITKEMVDVYTLSDEERIKADIKLPDSMADDDRFVELYTQIEWDPRSEHWTITEECNGAKLGERNETISPYFCTALRISAGEHYGTGLVESMVGECFSLDELEWRRLQITGLVAYKMLGIDENSTLRSKDIKNQRPGFILEGVKVRDGKVQDVGTIEFTNPNELAMIEAGINDKTQKLREVFLFESASGSPAGRDRVTAFERRRVAMELEGLLGGLYTPLADSQQIPMLNRAIHVLKKQKKLPPMPDNTVEIHTLTGLTALIRENRAAGLLELAEVARNLMPDNPDVINNRVLLDTYQRLRSIHAPGIVRTEEEQAAIEQRRRQAEIALAAGQQAVSSTGAIAEQAAQRVLPTGG